MDVSGERPKPSGIVIEWRENGDFMFSCRYLSATGKETPALERRADERHFFPTMTLAMGNVLRKLRREHISFPLFLMSLAFSHRNLLSEIDQLLHALHGHVEKQKGSGEYRCLITSSNENA
ncbi:MAG: hypothetical protein HGA97_08160 [Chlorobiaceae bacterium]|jgi:hypothetical protein|nr:hypothetical protein [Chlorobiaceae bacterium]